MENRILPADELPELNDLNDALVRDGKDAILPGGQDVVNRLRERAESAESRLAEAEKARDEAKAEAAACLRFMANALQWEGFRGEFLVASDEEKRSAHERNVQLLQNFLAETGHAKGMLEELEAADKKLAELSTIVEPLKELHDDATTGDLSAAHVYHARSILRDKLYEVFPKIAALVPPVEKEK